MFVIVAALIVIFLISPAWSDEGHGHNHGGSDVDIDTDVGVSAAGGSGGSVRDSSSALGLGAGDVDLAQCYRSYNYLIVWQDSKPNPLCLAQQLMAEGNYEAAARLRCQPWSVSRAFGGKDECITALSVPPPATPPMEAITDDHIDDEEEFHEEQQMLYADMQAKLANLEAELNKPAPVIQRTVVEQQPYLSDEKRAKLQALLEEDE
jgi:hypothetical protein